MELKDKVVVITGGSKGFGKELAKAFLLEESKVVICSHNKEEVEATSQEISAFGVYANVTSEEDLTNLAEVTIEKFGQIDIWINNAGMWLPHAIAEDLNMEEVREMFEVNVMGIMNGSRVALRSMKERSTGTIVNIISAAALDGRVGISAYASSKWAANGFTQSIRKENKDIVVLAVFPGGMKTEIFDKGKPDNFSDFMNPEEVAKKVIDNLKLDSPSIDLVIRRPEIL